MSRIPTKRVGINIAHDSADLHVRQNHAAARGGLENVENALAQTPAMHEQALETEGVSGEAQPQQVRMHTGQLVQNRAQVLRAPGNFHAHERFDGLGITERVTEAANAANTFCNIDELVDVARLDELLQSAMHEADLRNSLNNVLVFNHEIQMQRLGATQGVAGRKESQSPCPCYSPPFADASP